MRRWGVSALIVSHGWLTWAALAQWPRRPRSDAALVRHARRGSERALEQLINRYWNEVMRAAMAIVRDRQMAEEVAQEAMLAMTQSLDSYDERRRFGPWLHRIAANKARDRLRAEARRPRTAAPPDEWPASAQPEDSAATDSTLIKALGSLSADDRIIVFYRHHLGYSSSEIGDMLDMPGATVRTRLARAMPQLLKQMDSLAQGGEKDA